MKTLTEHDTLETVERKRHQVVDRGAKSFRKDWLDFSGWHSVPVPETYLEDDEIERLIRVFLERQVTSCWGIDNGIPLPSGPLPPVYVVDISPQSLRSFGNLAVSTDHLLLDKSMDFGLLTYCGDYRVYGANPELLEKLLGKSPDRALRDFIDYAGEFSHSLERQYLLKVAEEASHC